MLHPNPLNGTLRGSSLSQHKGRNFHANAVGYVCFAIHEGLLHIVLRAVIIMTWSCFVSQRGEFELELIWFSIKLDAACFDRIWRDQKGFFVIGDVN